MEQRPVNSLARKPRFSRSMLALIAFLGIALFFLLGEHRIHALAWLPLLLLLLACPLLHMTMHGGHGGNGKHRGHGSPQPQPKSEWALPQKGGKA